VSRHVNNANGHAPVDLDFVLKQELKAIVAKRNRTRVEGGAITRKNVEGNLFGIALSGGGVRAATLSYGFLEILNRCGLLELADYLSTVSGGGYTGGFVHTRLKEKQDDKSDKPYDHLFKSEDRTHLTKYGAYLAPGGPIKSVLTKLRLVAAVVASLLMNLLWVGALLLTLYIVLQRLLNTIPSSVPLGWYLFVCCALVLFLHILIAAIPVSLAEYRVLDKMNMLEGALLVLAFAYLVRSGPPIGFLADALRHMGSDSSSFVQPLLDGTQWLDHHLFGVAGQDFYITLAILLAVGFSSNPNVLGLHRFYLDRIADAYLKDHEQITLVQLIPKENGGPEAWGCAPYPLLNATLNLLGKEDETFEGTKTCDYFLLSPLYCGSKLTKYVSTRDSPYAGMTLATALAISGAAVSANMGYKGSRAQAFLMTLLNLRLGFWAANPRMQDPSLRFFGLCRKLGKFVFWPYYHLAELFARSNTHRCKVNLSDGGHIENLGVYELLRRRCKLIIVLDAGADEHFEFADLKNLVTRARNELGVKVTFREDPQIAIRPKPGDGFSQRHFVVADLEQLEGMEPSVPPYHGLLVYVKASLRPEMRWKRSKSRSWLYKIYHPAFPHESTADQFFDESQWEAYYATGKAIARNLLNIDEGMADSELSPQVCSVATIDELHERFDKPARVERVSRDEMLVLEMSFEQSSE
jgi:hypothetical protein